MDATPPLLGSTMTVTGWQAPANHVGVLLLSGQAGAFLPLGACHAYVDLGNLFVLHAFVVTAPTWSTQLPLPLVPELIGLPPLSLQTIFAPLSGPAVLSATNGMLLNLDLR